MRASQFSVEYSMYEPVTARGQVHLLKLRDRPLVRPLARRCLADGIQFEFSIPSSFHKLAQLQCVGRRCALLVVVEVHIDIVALLPPTFDLLGPLLQGRRRIVALVSSAGPVSPYVEKIRGTLPRCRRVMMVGQAERDVVVAKLSEDTRNV